MVEFENLQKRKNNTNLITTKMEPRIKSVTEAFSMQPETWYVFRENQRLPFGKTTEIYRIELERIGPDPFYDFMYRAYGVNGNKMHEWPYKSVSVSYFTESDGKD